MQSPTPRTSGPETRLRGERVGSVDVGSGGRLEDTTQRRKGRVRGRKPPREGPDRFRVARRDRVKKRGDRGTEREDQGSGYFSVPRKQALREVSPSCYGGRRNSVDGEVS